MSTDAGLAGVYSLPLAALSIFIAILSAYAALDLAGRVTTARGRMHLVWLCGGAIALGSGIWAMHYVGMEAFRLPMPVLYDWPIVLLSLLAAVAASGVALYLVSQPVMEMRHRLLGSVIMGSGIAAMHYIGMAAMRLPSTPVYSPGRVFFSVTVAIAISYVALRLAFALREDSTSWGLRKTGGALVLGVAIPVMHYSGMMAVSFVPSAMIHGSTVHAINVSSLGLASIVLITFVVLGIVIISAALDRRALAQAAISEDNLVQLRAVFDNMTEAIILVDLEKRTAQNNKAASVLLGVPKGSAPLQEILDSYEIFLPDGLPIAPALGPIRRALQGDYCKNFEGMIRKKDTGFSVNTEITTVPIAFTGKEASQVIVSIRDVTERTLAEELVRLQKSQLQNVFDNLNEGIVLMDIERNIVQINTAASRLLGISSSSLSRQSIADTFEVMLPNGESLPQEQWPSALAYKGEFLENREYKVRRTDTGDTILAQISTASVNDSSGKPTQIILSYRDITLTKEADEERRRLAAIVESSEDAIIGKSDKGIVTSWNRGAEKVFGYTAKEMVGESILRLLPLDRQDEETVILRRLKSGEVVEHFETVRVRKDGQLINVSLTISPIRDAKGVVIGASKIARDTTATRKLEQQLQQSQKMDAIGQLTGGIAHDFNNLLGVVIGNLDLLERRVAKDEIALRRVQTAQKAALRGADLTRRLLAFSSNEILSPTVVKLPHLIRNIMEMTARAIGAEIKMTTHFDASVPPLLIDAAGLESALVNLVVNARDAMPKGGTITISTDLLNLEETYPPVQAGELTTGRYASISVSDNGQGMSRQTLERAFEPFFTTKPRGKGTGLGLAMVYGFAKQSRGTVRIYSEPGFGSTVTLYLPVTEIGPQPESKRVTPVTRLDHPATVLVVDDEVDLLEIATTFLEDIGYEAVTAINGADALEVARQQKELDLLVTDIIMPGGMNGVELAQKVRQIHPNIKVIYCSGFPADALAERNMPLVDGPLLHKPYQRDEFSALALNVMAGDS